MTEQEELIFLESFAEKEVSLVDEQPQEGPDGWPYLLVRSTNKKTNGYEKEPVKQILNWLSEKGIGLVFNPKQPYPDYVFTYGMIWCFRQYDVFLWDDVDAKEMSSFVIPDYVKKVVKQFLQDQGVLIPKFLMVQNKDQLEICFSLDTLGDPEKNEHQGFCEAMSWFFPPGISIAVANEKGLPEFAVL